MEKDFISNLKKGRIILSLGTKGSGKTFLLLQYLKFALANNIYQQYVLILPAFSVEKNDSYAFLRAHLKSNKNLFIFEGYDPVISEQFIARQKKNKLDTLFVIDDASGEQMFNIDPDLKELITIARHILGDGAFWLLAHSSKKILSPFLRSNIDIIILSNLTSAKLLNDIYEEMLSLIMQHKDFIQIFKDDVKAIEYGAIYINLRAGKIDSKVKQWKLVSTDRKNIP